MKNFAGYCNVCDFWSNINSDHANYLISEISLSTSENYSNIYIEVLLVQLTFKLMNNHDYHL